MRNGSSTLAALIDPNHRCGYRPCGFKPKENPFYVALPYDDMEENGRRKEVNTSFPGMRLGQSNPC